MFCFGELGLSLPEIEDMTYVEFVLRQKGYFIRKKEELRSIRLLSYNNFIAHWDNPKKKPPTIDQYWDLDNNKSTVKVNPHAKEAYLKAVQDYLSKQNKT